MRFFLILGLMVSCTQQETPVNRCDDPRTVSLTTLCTSCAASPASLCPKGFRRATAGMGNAECSYTVDIAGRLVSLPGCRHVCEKQVTDHRCCPNFWGPLCLPCPSWDGRSCDWHGTCQHGNTGNGTCVCDEGFTGFACHECKSKNAYGEDCKSKCTCVNGECNNGPSGTGECLCQPPYSGPKCDQVTASCSNCTAYSYCKGEGGQATCVCLPGFKKVGRICTGVCSKNTCDPNAECAYLGARNFQCKCKEGYEGDGRVCIPVNPCSTDNGGCPTNSTICVYTGPGKSRCECREGMEGPSPPTGCRLKSACTDSTCDRTANCQTDMDGLPRCSCDAQQVGDGRRCYGNIMERVLELNRDGDHKGKLTGSVTLFEKGCELTMSKHGPFTVLLPLLKLPLSGISERFLCKHHLILGQRLYKDLQNNDFWTLGGEAVRFKGNKQFIFMKDPDTLYSIIQSDIAAANGIIHIIDLPITNIANSGNEQHVNMTIGELIAKDPKYNRFLSLVDNCGAPMPFRGPGPLTVFLPTNNAIDRFRDGSLMYMLTDARHKLQELLRHHIFSSAAITVDQIASMSEIQTMANQVVGVNVTSDGKVLLGEKGILLESTDIFTSNGVIHTIDGVLVPPSILPILPHRCDVNVSTIIVGPCVRCSYLYQTDCPPGSKELDAHLKDCEYQSSPLSSVLSSKGCAKYCNVTRTRAECCKGFYGPDCKPCIGGFQHPCYEKGTCFDGIYGNGTCRCNPGFEGVACHICSGATKYGENCDEDCRCVHGVCDNRPGSMGICRPGSCLAGYSGDFCDKEAKPCDSDGTYEHCHIHAYCNYDGAHTNCVCMSGYEGDGHSCSAVNPCLGPNRGGCDSNAQCVYAGPGNVSCVCNEGWTGDGLVCAEMNNCLLESRGGCDGNATCIFIGPGQNECMCKTGFMGNGKVCDLINPCLSGNGGCHMLAKCELQEGGGHVCKCPEGLGGDGKICYGNIMEELDGNWEFYAFNRILQKVPSLHLDGNVTALVPSSAALRFLKGAEKDFWLNPFVLPHLLKAHFLVGIFTLEDLKQNFNNELATLNPGTKWEIRNNSGEVKIQNATIRSPDIPVLNGYIHVIDQVLKPPLSDIPPLPPTLMEFLNRTPTFSLFRQAALAYNLTNIIGGKEYTVLMPTDAAIKEHLQKTNSTELGEDLFKYHILIDVRVYPEHLDHGMSKNTLLGSSFQILFHFDRENKTLANEVILSGNFSETFKGVVIPIPHILELHKNRCNKEIILKSPGLCTDCKSKPRCSFRSKPVQKEFPANMKSNCKYRKRVGARRRTMSGCVMDCFRYSEDLSCCPGYFGHHCFKCPGKIDNWCSNNGKCQDGILGSGECLCNEGFHGTACEDCEPGNYGKDCKSVCNCVHGKCVDGIDGNGKCLCYKGWRGNTCSDEIVMDACGGVCDVNANCLTGAQGTAPTCSCIAGYQGNGTFCKEINPCDNDNGHCSKNANCTKTNPGERTCTCHEGFTGDGVVCLEIDGCSENNGGCHMNAECIKTGPNMVACNCKDGYSGNGHFCFPVNPCRTENGGCSWNARCEYVGPGKRNCTCRYNYIGNGITCRGTVKSEILRNADASWFNRNLMISKVNDALTKGPLTAFVPHTNSTTNFPVESWKNSSRVGDLLRYHLVGCEQLLVSDLQSIGKVVSLSGHVLRFTYREGVLYINDDTRIITSDYVASNGVIHFIDKVLTPYDLSNRSKLVPTLNVTSAAEAYGYTTFSKLLQSSNLMSMVENSFHHPFTMLWPTDKVFSSLPEERKKWLYSEDHQDKLAAYLKAHIIRDTELLAVNLPHQNTVRTMYGSTLSFACDKDRVGDILVDDGNAKLIERHLMFDVGIAYGIDQLLEPPSMGARCDVFEEVKSQGRCGSCFSPPLCFFGQKSTDESTSCTYSRFSSFSPYQRRYDFYPYSVPYRSIGPYRGKRTGCQRTCIKVDWTPRCCKNHFGRDCQVCPGGLEAVCSNHGQCVDGMEGKGTCRCNLGFEGTACELCVQNYYGSNCTKCTCTKNGKCEDGLEGDGSCFCKEGWTGERCESKLEVKPTCMPECHPNAVCQPENVCVCESLYEGDGRNCTAPDLCSENNGGCHQHADCNQIGINVTCTCLSGYTGDGYFCSPIDRCVEEENGGCSDFATCLFTGPNERDCTCLPGYVGNGIQCLEKVVPPVDRCLENNGDCDPKADCKDLHFHENTAGVFHLRSPLGKYKLNYTDAETACQAEEATMATFSQLSDAQQLGMHSCVAGWIDGKQVGYPIRFPSVKCGDNHVGVVLYKNPVDPSSKYDTYCHRVKDVSCDCGSNYVGNGEYCNGNLVTVVATNSKFSVFYRALLSYANSTKDGERLMNYLLKRSTFVTLFVPENAGFYGNESLSWRDVEYHISTNNSIHLYNDLKHGAVIPSRLGYNLSVTITPGNTTLSDSSQLFKLVNRKQIIDWDIPATNGIIHIIKGPLKAPPKPVRPMPSASHAQSGTGAVASVLIVFLLIAVVAGLGYYFLKHRNNAFRFQYFKNDDDEGNPSWTEGNSSLVSIPNPLYTGYSAFVEPFGDSPEADSPGTHHVLEQFKEQEML
ncbi:stabilin-1 [Anguilla rostrata]|uniref:stabilin-1 n=1 Tax=Anguilla rostrata TaxID=7938 RepID=UPI0030CBA65C